jgi:hypothetical protein
MTDTPKQPVNLDALRAALRAAAEDFLRRVAEAHPGETMYGFLFEISASQFGAHGTVATEEGLTRFAERYIAGADADDELARVGLDRVRSCFRWASPEDAWYQHPDDAFDAVNALLNRAEEEGLYERYSNALEKQCIEALKEMEAAGTFGAGADRERVVLGVCYIGGDNSAREFLGWARKANPPKVYKRLRQEYLEE